MKKNKFLLILSLLIISSCNPNRTISRKDFEKIEIGMTVNEVKSILGAPHKVTTDRDSNTYYFYKTQDNFFAKRYASVKFDNRGWLSFKYFGKKD